MWSQLISSSNGRRTWQRRTPFLLNLSQTLSTYKNIQPNQNQRLTFKVSLIIPTTVRVLPVPGEPCTSKQRGIMCSSLTIDTADSITDTCDLLKGIPSY